MCVKNEMTELVDTIEIYATGRVDVINACARVRATVSRAFVAGYIRNGKKTGAREYWTLEKKVSHTDECMHSCTARGLRSCWSNLVITLAKPPNLSLVTHQNLTRSPEHPNAYTHTHST